MKHYQILLSALAMSAVPSLSSAQHIQPGYIDWGITGSDFPTALQSWQKGDKWSEDDNFFISRVKPKMRFRNASTQVNPALDESTDKNLIFWVPINNPGYNALPDGVFDSEVFPMWSYITHYGNWSTPLVRMPGNFIDVAHKNGVPVSVVASVPFGNISTPWKKALSALVVTGPEKMADFLQYYGVDGLGYNSEFLTTASIPQNLATYHGSLIKLLKSSGRMPLAENIWYDGTNVNGKITFDRGLGDHNAPLWGSSDEVKTSLFFNYNWNKPELLSSSVEYARQFGRTPLDLYCGINMQGKEPLDRTNGVWTLLKDYPLSIGLWGAHSKNMFFESRAEKGTDPEMKQRVYLQRVERWFTGGSRNPVNSPAINNSMKVVADNYDFFGMSKMMSARSALSWDLSEEPFYTYFNLGNGRFFNYRGLRQHSREWYNIGMQDYLPTWMWWFANKFMGRTPADVPVSGLDAEFTWDDAWMGGSLLRVFGTSAEEYLHLFKTDFKLQRGDIITIRYKVVSGASDMSLALSTVGNENTPVDESKLKVIKKEEILPGAWNTVSFKLDTELSVLENKRLALVALHFTDADNLDLRLGEFSIVRGNATSSTPAKPVVERATLLAANASGADGKIIFNMPNNKGNDVCYNIDVKTSLFKIYSQQKGSAPVLMGMTPSWAGMIYSAPIDNTISDPQIRFGVSAMSLDMSSESDIAWSNYFAIDNLYQINDDIIADKELISTDEPFSIAYADPCHETAEWILQDREGNIVGRSDNSSSLDIASGLDKAGNYDLTVTGYVAGEDGRVITTRKMPAFIQVMDKSKGNLPEIISLTADGHSDAVRIEPGDEIKFEYQNEIKDGKTSRGIRVDGAGLGFNMSESGYTEGKPFSISFWIKPDGFDNSALHLLSIRDKGDKWANNNWGWFWNTLNPDGSFSEFKIRDNYNYTIDYNFGDVKLQAGVWQHLTYVFDFDIAGGVMPSLYLNGKQVPLKSYMRDEMEFSGDDMEYEILLYPWREGNVASVGGYLHNSGSIRGSVDNFMYWDKALKPEEAERAMGNISPDALPSGLHGYVDFESDALPGGKFVNQGSGKFEAGNVDYVATEVEGQGTLAWKEPVFCPGSPFVEGASSLIASQLEWKTPGAVVLSKSGDLTSGDATMRFPTAGRYEVGISLANAYGKTEKFVTVTVGDADHVQEIVDESAMMYVSPNPFESEISLTAASTGLYRITLLDMEGRIVGQWSATLTDGETHTIHPQVSKGMYLLHVSKEGSTSSTYKLIRK